MQVATINAGAWPQWIDGNLPFLTRRSLAKDWAVISIVSQWSWFKVLRGNCASKSPSLLALSSVADTAANILSSKLASGNLKMEEDVRGATESLI